jgi:dTDP-4-amino-4,6-dideoxygalactose transaminase
VIAVHLYGRPADTARLKALCRKHGIALIEDAAQAHGAWVEDFAPAGRRSRPAQAKAIPGDGANPPFRRADPPLRRAGAVGDIGCFSFYPSKNLGAAGEGGAVVTANPALAERIRRLRNHGQKVRYRHDTLGFNYRMDGIQGLFLGLKLPFLDRMNARRVAIAARYLELMDNPKVKPLGAIPGSDGAAGSVWHLFVVKVARRTAFQKHLDALGIGSSIHYPNILPELPPFRPYVMDARRFPVSSALSRSVVSLPMFYGMADAQVERVAEAVNAFG